MCALRLSWSWCFLKDFDWEALPHLPPHPPHSPVQDCREHPHGWGSPNSLGQSLGEGLSPLQTGQPPKAAALLEAIWGEAVPHLSPHPRSRLQRVPSKVGGNPGLAQPVLGKVGNHMDKMASEGNSASERALRGGSATPASPQQVWPAESSP